MKRVKTIPNAFFLYFIFGIILIPVFLTGSRSQKIELLLRQNRFQEVEAYCAQLKGKQRTECYRLLGDAYFNAGKFSEAGECYGKCGYTQGYNRIGEAFLQSEKPVKAVEYFEKGEPSSVRASAYEQSADEFSRKNRENTAKKYYSKAIKDYETLLKCLDYEWKNEYFDSLKRCFVKWDQLDKSAKEQEEKALLDTILDGGRRYCDKMKSWAFHFFCLEDMSEYRDYSKKSSKNFKIDRYGLPESNKKLVAKKNYIYEYQLIREGKKVQETRTLLEQNGIKKNEPNAQLYTHGYKYEKLIFGPLALLSKYWQKYFYYKVLRKDTLWGEKVVVIEAIPLQFNPKNRLFGSLWISENDFSVLKIEWQPKSMGATAQIRENAQLLKAEPSISFYAEFKYKKKGIRFPSRYYLEEAYIDKKGKKNVRLRQDIHLRDYRFFVVGTEITETQPMK